MSMKTVPWDLEERAEDAIVAYLKANVGRACVVRAAREVAVAKYPLITVSAEESNNESDIANFNGRRRFSVTVTIATEAVNFNAETSQLEYVETARESHRAVKSDVMGSLAGATVHEDLNETQYPGILFSQAHCTTQTRGVEDNKLITVQTIDVIAQPKEL